MSGLLIDGDSNDGTKEILEKYRNDMAIYISEKDAGIYDAMNKGVTLAQGEYLLFLNGGDYLENANILHKVFGQKKPPNKDIIYGNEYFVDKNKNRSLVRTLPLRFN